MFENKTVISYWDERHRAYKVIKVIFDKNPNNLKFTD